MKYFIFIVLCSMFLSPMVIAAAVSFVQWDITLMNPANWKEGFRVATSAWVILVGVIALIYAVTVGAS